MNGINTEVTKIKEWKVITAIVLVIALTALATAVAFASFTRPQQIPPQTGSYGTGPYGTSEGERENGAVPYGQYPYGYGEREGEGGLTPYGPYGSYYPPSYVYPPPQYSYPPPYGGWGGHE